MVVWHVTTLKKLKQYLAFGYIQAPVRAWTDISSAERFSKQTGRRIILRLKLGSRWLKELEGHRGEAVISATDCPISAASL